MYRSAWCEINLQSLRSNLSTLRTVASTRTLLVVKANAYGHGILRIAREAVGEGVNMLGVATIGEAALLQDERVQAPSLVLCALDPTEIEFCVANGVHFMAWRPDQFEVATRAAAKYARSPLIHLEIDTGMSRSGRRTRDLKRLLVGLSDQDRSGLVGMMTHFHSADVEDLDSAEGQLGEFRAAVETVQALGLNPLLHVANSPGTLRLPQSRMDMVRLGVVAYGLPPSAHVPPPESVRPVLSWMATVTNLQDLDPGQGVGYGWRWRAEAAGRVATLAVGYADGYHRTPLGVNSVLLHGVECPVVGSVFMDQCLVALPINLQSAVKLGDVAVLLGTQGDCALSADDLAERWGTNNYDVVAGIRERVPRRYVP